MKQPEHSYDADRSENRNNYFGKLVVCANVEHIPILWPSTSAPVWRHTFQNCMHMFTKVPVCQHQNIYVIPKKYNVSASTIHISPKLETTQLSTEKWINNLCSIQTMAHYNNESVSEGRVTPGARCGYWWCSASWPGCWFCGYLHFVEAHWAVHLGFAYILCIMSYLNKNVTLQKKINTFAAE